MPAFCSPGKRLFRTCAVVTVLLGLFSCNGSSCSGPGYEVGTGEALPEEKLLEPALQLRVTREGAEFLSQNGAAVLQGLLGSSDGDWVDASEIVNQFVGDLSLFGLSASDVVAAMRLPDPDGLTIEFLSNPTRIHVEIDELHVRVEATVSTSSAACRVRGDVAAGSDRRMFTLRNLVLEVELDTTPDGGFDVSTNVMSVEIDDSGVEVVTDSADPDYYCNLAACAGDCGDCQAVCETAGFADDVANFFIEAFDSLVGTLAELVVNSVLSQVERLSGSVHPALLLGSLLQDVYDAEALLFGLRGTEGGFEVLERPDEFGPQGDLQVMLALGTAPAAVHPCVKPLSVDPQFPQAELVPLSVPKGADLGVGIPEAFIDQLLWSLYASGALCLEVDSGAITELTDGTLNLSVGLVSLLLPGIEEVAPADSPLILTLRPELGATDFPLVRLGQDPEGGLIELTLPEVAIGIYAEVDEEFVRLIEVSVTIDASVTPVVSGDGTLAIGIERLDVSNVASVYDELFAEVELSALLDFVVELLGRALVGEELALPLTVDDLVQQLLGASLSVEVLDISSTGAGWLSMSVGLAPSANAPLRVHAETRLTSEPALEVITGEPLLLQVPGDVEVQWSIDGLAWTPFRGGPDLKSRVTCSACPAHTSCACAAGIAASSERWTQPRWI